MHAFPLEYVIKIQRALNHWMTWMSRGKKKSKVDSEINFSFNRDFKCNYQNFLKESLVYTVD